MTLACHKHEETKHLFPFCSILLHTYSPGQTMSPFLDLRPYHSPLSFLQLVCILLGIRGLKLPSGLSKSLQPWLYQCWTPGKDYCTYFAGDTCVYTSPTLFVFFAILKHCWLMFSSCSTAIPDPHYQESTIHPVSGKIMPKEWVFIIIPAEDRLIFFRLFLQFAIIILNGSPAF